MLQDLLYLLDLKGNDGELAMESCKKQGSKTKIDKKIKSKVYCPTKCGQFTRIFPTENVATLQQLPKVGDPAMKHLLSQIRKKYI